ncbi:collagenase-like protease [Helicobacter sp. 16-1353]|nr:collagenase-like protease [Helicobacter sp. 16-1353]
MRDSTISNSKDSIKKVELLSPAGNFHKLKIALSYGADAVYGGVSHFSLRNRSGKEFTYESFADAVSYTHKRGKKIYATINGFPFNSQINSLKNHIAKMRDLGVNAFIVATPGVIKLCKEIAPNIPLHLSTQANVLNGLDAEVFYELGVRRIVAARELSLKDAMEIKSHIPELEIEIFIHGSMCFAFSGRCLISSLQNGRVPNRGSCANDCRFDYEFYVKNPDNGVMMRLEEEEGVGSHIFNAKDLNLSQHIDTILDSGAISALKIEGRTKSAYYAALTTRTYRMAIDDFYAGKSRKKLYKAELDGLQNRGFTDGYIIHRPFERQNTQNLESAISMGEYQVSGEVREDGEYALCKFTTKIGEVKEIIAPLGSEIPLINNEIGEIFRGFGDGDSSKKDSIDLDSADLDSSLQDFSDLDSNDLDSSTADSIKKDSNEGDFSDLDSNKKDSAELNSVPKNSSVMDSSTADSANLDSTNLDSAEPDSSPQDSIQDSNKEIKYFIRFKKILLENGKELSEIHSGNVNYFKLPFPLPPHSFLRQKVE